MESWGEEIRKIGRRGGRAGALAKRRQQGERKRIGPKLWVLQILSSCRTMKCSLSCTWAAPLLSSPLQNTLLWVLAMCQYSRFDSSALHSSLQREVWGSSRVLLFLPVFLPVPVTLNSVFVMGSIHRYINPYILKASKVLKSGNTIRETCFRFPEQLPFMDFIKWELGEHSQAIKARIAMAHSSFLKMKNGIDNKNLKLALRRHIEWCDKWFEGWEMIKNRARMLCSHNEKQPHQQNTDYWADRSSEAKRKRGAKGELWDDWFGGNEALWGGGRSATPVDKIALMMSTLQLEKRTKKRRRGQVVIMAVNNLPTSVGPCHGEQGQI